MPVDNLAPNGAWPSADTVMTSKLDMFPSKLSGYHDLLSPLVTKFRLISAAILYERHLGFISQRQMTSYTMTNEIRRNFMALRVYTTTESNTDNGTCHPAAITGTTVLLPYHLVQVTTPNFKIYRQCQAPDHQINYSNLSKRESTGIIVS